MLPPRVELFVSADDTARVLVPTQPDDLIQGQHVWHETSFDGAVAPNWFDATNGIGFDTTGTSNIADLIHPEGNLHGPMYGQNASALFRFDFQVSMADNLESLELKLDFNDGYVAYLNGREVARQNAPAGTPAFDASANAPPPDGRRTRRRGRVLLTTQNERVSRDQIGLAP